MLSISHLLGPALILLYLCSRAAAVPVPQSPPTSRYTAVVAFGDSFTDNGTGAWVITNHTWPADPHYAGGRFSNGPVWVEYLSANLSVPLVDYAVGGATTSNAIVQGFTGPGSTIPVPSIDSQVTAFLTHPPADVPLSRPLFVLLGGANDPLFDPTVTAARSFHALMASAARLAAAHPRAHLAVLNYPALARLPVDFYLDAPTKAALRAFAAQFAALLRAAAHSYGDGEGDGGLTLVDLAPLFAEFDYYGAPAAYGFAPLGAYGSCLTGAYGETPNVTLCEDPDEMVFWDEYHPTTHAHSWAAKLVLDTLGR